MLTLRSSYKEMMQIGCKAEIKENEKKGYDKSSEIRD
jgi:hypothetical protein